MTNTIVIPDEACKYILFQRTAYLSLTNTFPYKVAKTLLPFLTYNRAVALEAKLRNRQIKRMYQDDMLKEYSSIRSFLPDTCSSILDIGCGVAGIDVLLSGHYRAAAPEFYLLDKSHVEQKVYYQYKTRGAFYNSLAVAKKLLRDNGIPEQKIHLLEATDDNAIAVERKIDLIVSLISWGFHYPVETYLDHAHAALYDGGSLILDVRRDTGGLEALKKKFSKVDVITAAEKYHRVRAMK